MIYRLGFRLGKFYFIFETFIVSFDSYKTKCILFIVYMYEFYVHVSACIVFTM